MGPRNQKPGFTVIELLVVVGIIATMIAILLPALARARAAGQGAVCLGNLRNMANAAGIYESENHGYLPNGCISTAAVDPAVWNYVDPGILNNMGTGCYGWNPWWSWIQSSYAFNSMSMTATPITPKVTSIPDSSEVVLVADILTTNGTGVSVTYNDGSVRDAFAGGYTTPFQTAGRPNFHGRHNGAGSVLWVDGHASREIPVRVPGNVNVSLSKSDLYDCVQSAQYYNSNHLGYLARNLTDYNSMSQEYYFVFNKRALGLNNLHLYLDKQKSLWK